MERPYGRGNDQEFKSERPSPRLRASHRIYVRSRGGALRYRHRLKTIRRKRRHAPVASRVPERLKDVNDGVGGNSEQPRLALGTWHLALHASAETRPGALRTMSKSPVPNAN